MKLLVFDGNSIMNRAFYGIRMLSTKDGVFTNAIYGFVNILNREIETEKPDYIAVAFDLRAPTFRHKQYELYKANRKGMPDELAMQMPYIKEILSCKGIKTLEKEGYEADDIIGTLARQCDDNGCECVIITGDKDDLQLVSGNVTCKLTVTKGGKNETVSYTPEIFFEKYGFEPIKLIDLKALWGDTSDNIPGVAKIGEKTATELVSKYGTIEEIYENMDESDIKETLKARLKEGRDNAFLSKSLATIVKDVPLDTALEDLKPSLQNDSALLEIYTKLELRTFAEKIRMNPTKKEKTDFAVQCKHFTDDEAEEYCGVADKLAVIVSDKVYISNGETVICCDSGKPLLNCAAQLYVHDIKSFMTRFGEIEQGRVRFDTMTAAYLLDPAASAYTPSGLAAEYLGINAAEQSACAAKLFELSQVLDKKLEEYGMSKLYREIELPLSFVLYRMEKRGFKADSDALKSFGDKLDIEIKQLEKLIYDLSGEEFNINSPKQLGEVLFDKLQIPGGKKNKNGAYKTDADRLEKLAQKYPVVQLVLNYRQLSKLKSTYADGLLKVIDESDGRIHSTFNQTVTTTGRISSTDPNLQNIPVRTELGRELRYMFIAKEGYVLLDADYSQIELRVLGSMAEDQTMIDAFRNGDDIHAITASKVFGVPLEFVTPDMRSSAKAVNFGIVYGISAFGLADNIGVSNRDAKMYIDSYFDKYSGIKRYLDRLVEDAKSNGFVTTAFGRRRYLPELSSSNYMIRSFGERAAMNTPIQGTAADIIKLAMVRVEDALSKAGLKAKLILQIHDELIIECPEDEIEKASEILKTEMESAVDLKAPLLAEVGVGKNWHEAK